MQTVLPVLETDPFAPAVLADPGLFHDELRAAGPVVYLSRYGIYASGRYREVHAALVDWQDFQSGAGVGLSTAREAEPGALLESDPPWHDAPRRVLDGVLGPESLRRLRTEWSAVALDLVDEVLAGGDVFDAVPRLAEAFPLRVFPDAVGLRAVAGREHLLPYGDHVFNLLGPHNDLVAEGEAELGAHAAWVSEQCQRDRLVPGGFGARIWGASDRGEITPEQAPLVVHSLLWGGVDTTVHMLGALLHALATHPDQWALLRRSPELARVAVDEAIRLESPVRVFFRTTSHDTVLAGVPVPAGEKVLLFLGAANRDPRHWVDPGHLDLRRNPAGHVGFGIGIHQCAGQHVARAEGAAVLRALLARVATLELAGEPERHLNNALSAWASLPLRVTPA